MVTSYSDADSVTAAAVVVSMETDLYIHTTEAWHVGLVWVWSTVVLDDDGLVACPTPLRLLLLAFLLDGQSVYFGAGLA